MTKKASILLLFICATLFGFSYISLSKASVYLSPFTVNFIRYFLGFICLIPFIIKKSENNTSKMLVGAFLASITLVISTYIQQYVSGYVQAGKMGFITSLYVVMTPVISFIFLKKRYSYQIIISIILALVGFYFLCNISDLKFNKYELLLLLVALTFSFEILIIEKYSEYVDPVKFMAAIFVYTFIIDFISALIFEDINITNIIKVSPSLLYLGILATGCAYVFQGIGQKYLDATIASLIMGLESVMSVIAGYLIFNQVLSIKEIIGCIFVFIAITICSIFSNKIVKKEKSNGRKRL